MTPLHRVYFLGHLIRDPEVRYAPNGTAVARCGLAVPTHIRKGNAWQDDVCRIDVVVFGRQAERVCASLRTGQGVLIEGHVQRRWAQEGQSRRTQEVIAERIRLLPRAGAGACPAAGRPAVEALSWAGGRTHRDAHGESAHGARVTDQPQSCPHEGGQTGGGLQGLRHHP